MILVGQSPSIAGFVPRQLNVAQRVESLGFYRDPPLDGDISLTEFERAAWTRMNVLKEIEQFQLKGEESERIRNLLKKQLPLQTQEDCLFDVLSHFVLRFAFCKPGDRHWFVSQETQVLKSRLHDVDIVAFVKHNQLSNQYRKIADASFEEHQADLQALHGDAAGISADNFYLANFEEGNDLVAKRSVLVVGGFIIVHRTQLISLILARFKSQLHAALDRLFHALPVVTQDERLEPIIKAVSRGHLDVGYKKALQTGDRVTPADLDMVSKVNMPLCMRTLHEALRSNHHLKHQGRLQYGLFLKGVGLTLEESLELWKSEFSRAPGAVNFDSHYAYSIRHNYGKEGRKTDYNPYSCAKIILNPEPSIPESPHGCPFKCFDPARLSAQMTASSVPTAEQKAIVDLVRTGAYQVACKRYFEATHPGSADTPELSQTAAISHPNRYFDLSMKFTRARAQPGGQPQPKAQTPAALPPSTAAPIAIPDAGPAKPSPSLVDSPADVPAATQAMM
jgi:DNA primase large subunit